MIFQGYFCSKEEEKLLTDDIPGDWEYLYKRLAENKLPIILQQVSSWTQVFCILPECPIHFVPFGELTSCFLDSWAHWFWGCCAKCSEENLFNVDRFAMCSWSSVSCKQQFLKGPNSSSTNGILISARAVSDLSHIFLPHCSLSCCVQPRSLAVGNLAKSLVEEKLFEAWKCSYVSPLGIFGSTR